jgi:hypothetical protein
MQGQGKQAAWETQTRAFEKPLGTLQAMKGGGPEIRTRTLVEADLAIVEGAKGGVGRQGRPRGRAVVREASGHQLAHGRVWGGGRLSSGRIGHGRAQAERVHNVGVRVHH